MRTDPTTEVVPDSDRQQQVDAPTDTGARGRRPASRLGQLSLIVLTLVVATGISMLRRPDELFAHYVWVEEGLILHRTAEHGWAAAVMPVQGQFYLVTTACFVLVTKISWLLLPVIDYVLAVGVFAVTALLLLVPRSRLGPLWLRCLMVLALALVPTNPEVYDVMLYTFWWTSLWPLICFTWKDPHPWLRVVILAAAGLNSLAAASLCVVYAFGAVVDRSRQLLVGALVLGGTLVVQALAWAYSPRRESLALRPVATLKQTFVNFFEYVVQPVLGARTVPDDLRTVVGVALVAAAVLACRSLATREDRLLGYALVVATLVLSGLSAVPAPFIAHPILAGPRYFFLPFASSGLLLLFLIGRAPRRVVVVLTAVCLAWSMVRVPDAFTRRSDRLDWRAALEKCAHSPHDTYRIPFQYDGLQADLWRSWSFDRSVCVGALR